MSREVAIITRFHKGVLEETQRVADIFDSYGICTINPLSFDPIDTNEEFVRLHDDDPEKSNQELQEEANWRIAHASLVYVYCSGGYLGKHTQAELFIARDNERPILFSAFPLFFPPEKSEYKDYIQEIARPRIRTPDRAAELMLKQMVTPFIVR